MEVKEALKLKRELEESISNSLKQFSEQTGTTVYHINTTVYAYSYTKEGDVVPGYKIEVEVKL